MGYYAAPVVREIADAPYIGEAPERERAPVSASDLQDLGHEIATLAADLHAETYRLLVLIARFDRARGWALDGQRSCAHWLALRTGIEVGAAREKVRAARALQALPLTGAAMARGELSFSKVRALSRVATPETEGELLELAHDNTTAQLERLLRARRKGSRQDEAEWERERHRLRALYVYPDNDGMYVVRGRLQPEVGALLMRAIEAASDALFRENPSPAEEGTDPDREHRQRRADALGLLAERAMAAAEGEISGARAERYQVMVHVDPATLAAEGEPGRSELEDGTRLSAETSRRLCCDASVVQVARGEKGEVLGVGRRTRTIPSALRRALEVRDRGCRFPGCGLRFTDAHHVRHWADGGTTSLDNCLLLCRHHHRLVHEEGWTVQWRGEDGRAAFIDPRGRSHFDSPPRRQRPHDHAQDRRTTGPPVVPK